MVAILSRGRWDKVLRPLLPPSYVTRIVGKTRYHNKTAESPRLVLLHWSHSNEVYRGKNHRIPFIPRWQNATNAANASTSQWCHINVMMSHITSIWDVCSAPCWGWQQRKDQNNSLLVLFKEKALVRGDFLQRDCDAECVSMPLPNYEYSISQEICTRFCCALLCCGYAIVHNEFTWSIYPYSSGLLCWHWGNR